MTLAITITGCDKTIFPDPPLKSGEMQATISGFGSFFATDAVTKDAGTYFIRASIPSSVPTFDSVVIAIVASKQVTTPYTIDFSTDATSSMDYCIVNSNGTCNNYRVQKGKGNGTLKISSISPNVEGTFSGTFQSLTGSGSVTITNGAFNSPF